MRNARENVPSLLACVIVLSVSAGCAKEEHTEPAQKAETVGEARPDGVHFTSVNGDGKLSVRITLTPEILAFNPGLDPNALKPFDEIYLPSEREVELRRELGDAIWVKELAREFELDLNGDGRGELLKFYLLRHSATVKPVEGVAGMQCPGNGFLTICVRNADAQWTRTKTLLLGGRRGNVAGVELHPIDGKLRLLEVREHSSGGATSMGQVCFFTCAAEIKDVRRVSFTNGFMDGKWWFGLTGSAGYGLSFRLSEDSRTIVFKKYETTPIRVLDRAEYRLEKGEGILCYGFVLVKEERVPLSQMDD